jgi:hypothetical protein
MTRAWYPIAIAAALHTVLAISVAPRFEVDSSFYTTQAEALVAHGASLDATGQPETRYTPGYPAFLAAFLAAGLGYAGAIVAQHVLWVCIVAAAVWLVLRAGGSQAAAVAAGVIAALDLPGVQSSISVLSETLAAATLIGAVCCTFLAMRANRLSSAARWCVLAGALAGATALVRPIAIALGLALALAIIVGADRRWRIAAAATLVAVFAVLPVFWTLRNARETGVATLSSLAGINLLHFRAAATLAVRDPGGIDANLIRHRDALEARACRDLEAEYGRPCASISWAERSKTYSAVAVPIILGDPIASAQQAARALGMIVLGGGANLLSEVTGMSERTARLVCLAYTAPLALLALIGIPYWWRRDRAFASLLLLVLAYMLGMALGAEAYSRFRVPVIALYGIVCAGGVTRLGEFRVARPDLTRGVRARRPD